MLERADPHCTPIWANRPDVGIAHCVHHLIAVQQANMVKSE
jgi:hypothetical protein